VADASTDGSREFLEAVADSTQHDPPLVELPWAGARIPTGNTRILFHPSNRGKGAALRLGFGHARGDVILVQDADLEYEPQEYSRLRKPIQRGVADVLRRIILREYRLAFELEVTAKVAKGEWRVYEIPISYHGRTYAEGK